jgi:alanyl-tRNA synthetase
MFTTDDLRKKWLDFYRERKHIVIPSASVVPENDPTALFHNSGMHPLIPYLMGEPHPEGVRLASSQKCIRTIDIDEVGDATHLTFFEMLGNWSLGDYFKKEKIAWSFEFLTEALGLPLEKLAVSVYEGDEHVEKDTLAADRWVEVGIPRERVAFLPASENWWAVGDAGPCGPDSEMFYWTGDGPAPKSFQESWEDPHWVEIGNDVFMTFNRKEDGKLEPLPQKNVDTGMGLERLVTVINGFQSIYQTDAFADVLSKIAELSGHPEIVKDPIAQTDIGNSSRIIADHVRTATVMIGDGIVPSNTDQGYILRRLIRRAIRHGRRIGIEHIFCSSVAEKVITKLSTHYSDLKTKESFIVEELNREEKQFSKTLEKGEKEFEKLSAKILEFSPKKEISGKCAFNLYETYGFPLEMTIELAREQGMTVHENGFYKAQELHQQKSRAGAENKFKGGLGDTKDATVKLHTTAHLMVAALREVLGEHISQKGSNITPERLRFDFAHEEKMTEEQKTAVEKWVNAAIAADAKQTLEEIPKTEAENDSTIIGAFWEKYPDTVKVYTFKDDTGKVWSRELCGGPHRERTGDLGTFKIKKEESSSRGVRRIKAVLTNL